MLAFLHLEEEERIAVAAPVEAEPEVQEHASANEIRLVHVYVNATFSVPFCNVQSIEVRRRL